MKLNGNLKWIIGVLIGLAITALSIVGQDVKKNTAHRHQFEEKVANIERDIGKILTAVEKLGKE